jgi:hypothetical protein
LHSARLSDRHSLNDLTIEVRGAEDFAARMPEQALELMTVTADVNLRYVERGKPPALTLILV